MDGEERRSAIGEGEGEDRGGEFGQKKTLGWEIILIGGLFHGSWILITSPWFKEPGFFFILFVTVKAENLYYRGWEI